MKLKRNRQSKKTPFVLSALNLFMSEKISLKTGEVVLVGLSGGPDSIALAHALKTLEKERGYMLKALHLNHLLRGKESKRDEAFVRRFCKEHNLPLLVSCENVSRFARLQKTGIEEAARKCRLHFFQESAQKYNARYVFTAHTKDDQLETVLMKLFRGAGLRGAGGMKNITVLGKVKIARPLLELNKEEVFQYNRENNISFVKDSSNEKTDFFRNKLRLKIIPYLKKECGTFGNRILDFADIVRDFDEFFQKNEDRFFQKVLFYQNGKICVSHDLYERFPFYVAIFGIRSAIEKYFPGSRLPNKRVWEEKHLALRKTQTGKRLDINGRLVFLKERECDFILEKKTLSQSGKIAAQISTDSAYSFFNWNICFQKKAKTKDTVNRSGLDKRFIARIRKEQGAEKTITLFLPEKVKTLTMRSVKEGDRIIFEKDKSKHSKKVKNLFVDAKIPFFLKKRIPLVIYRKKIICIPGLYIHPDYRKGTKGNSITIAFHFKPVG